MNISNLYKDYLDYYFENNEDDINNFTDELLNNYNNWGYNYDSIRDISAKGDIIQNDKLDIDFVSIFNINNTIIILTNYYIYWYSRIGKLQEQYINMDLADLIILDNVITISNPFEELCDIHIHDYLEENYLVKIDSDIST